MQSTIKTLCRLTIMEVEGSTKRYATFENMVTGDKTHSEYGHYGAAFSVLLGVANGANFMAGTVLLANPGPASILAGEKVIRVTKLSTTSDYDSVAPNAFPGILLESSGPQSTLIYAPASNMTDLLQAAVFPAP